MKIAYVDIDILFLVFAQTFRVVLILVREANMHSVPERVLIGM